MDYRAICLTVVIVPIMVFAILAYRISRTSAPGFMWRYHVEISSDRVYIYYVYVTTSSCDRPDLLSFQSFISIASGPVYIVP